MVDYSKGKIYKIVVNNTDEEYRPYIGSTTKEYLSQRFVSHKGDYSRYKNGKHHPISSFILFDKYGIENCEIVLIENYPCTTKDELRARERYWFDNIENCNICKPALTDYENNNVGKIRYQQQIQLNPNRNKEQHKKCIELYPEYCKKKYQRAKELHPDFSKQKYERAKELHPEYLEKYTCECGSHIRKGEKSRHNKSKKHLNYIATIAIQQEV